MKQYSILSIIITILWSCNPPIQKEVSNDKSEDIVTFELSESINEDVTSLAQHPKIKEAFQYIIDTDVNTIKDLVTLTEIESPPFKETVRGIKYAEMLKAEGLDSVWTDEIGNVIGLRKGEKGNKVLALAAHLDTVFPEGTSLKVKQVGDTLYAPGIADDTRGLVTLLTTLRAMNAANIRTEAHILFIGDVGEEGLGDLRGMKHLFRDGGPKIDYFISVDGAEAEFITNGGLGSHRYRITFRGPGGHSWGAFGLGNPHHALGSDNKIFC